MIFKDNEYGIGKYVKNGKIEESIIITKEALEQWRDHYLEVAVKHKNEARKWAFFVGKANALIDILKHFDEMEV